MGLLCIAKHKRPKTSNTPSTLTAQTAQENVVDAVAGVDADAANVDADVGVANAAAVAARHEDPDAQ